MELRTLRAFVEVVRQGGFSQAAETIFATQSTVSKAVRRLEGELGVPLLNRIGHRSTLTAAGEVVYRQAVGMLAQRDSLIAELDDLRGLKKGVLRIGLPLIGSNILFAPVFSVFRQRHPGIDIRLIEQGSDRLEDILRAGEIDLAGSLLPVSEEFEWQEVWHEPLVALIRSDHALAGQSTLTLVDLKDMPFILFEAGFALNRIILDACRRHAFEPVIAAQSGQVDFLVELAADGLGVAFLPRMIAERRRLPAVSHILLDEPKTDWNMAMLWRRGAYLSHAASAWLAIVREIHATG